MPELPEVETVRRSLVPHMVGRSIAAVTVNRADIITGDAAPRALLRGQRITAIERRGKQIALIADSGRAVIVQLGMTGQVLVARAGEAPPDHVHAVWTLDQGATRILFRDPRRFGGLTTLPHPQALASAWANLGPDALTIAGDDLWANLRTTRRSIKAALLDQSVLAGVGNIYADESLFMAGVHPKALTHRLPRDRIERLAESIRTVLARAVQAGGTTLRDYVDANGTRGGYLTQHAVYGRHGQPCTACGNTLKKSSVAQRTTTHCPNCQAR